MGWFRALSSRSRVRVAVPHLVAAVFLALPVAASAQSPAASASIVIEQPVGMTSLDQALTDLSSSFNLVYLDTNSSKYNFGFNDSLVIRSRRKRGADYGEEEVEVSASTFGEKDHQKMDTYSSLWRVSEPMRRQSPLVILINFN